MKNLQNKNKSNLSINKSDKINNFPIIDQGVPMNDDTNLPTIASLKLALICADGVSQAVVMSIKNKCKNIIPIVKLSAWKVKQENN